MSKVPIRLTVNEREVEVWVRPNQTLVEVLREDVGATEVKYGCGEGICGTCAVLLDRESVNSCLMYAVQVDGAAITTLKGLAGDDMPLHPLQERLAVRLLHARDGADGVRVRSRPPRSVA
jgi:aerobic carbon-monoxide dehydrogenase small subunit